MPDVIRGFIEDGVVKKYDYNYSANSSYVTPEMFGAKGDGETDDTEAFTACAQSARPVVIPAKSYNLSGVVFINNKVDDNGVYTNKRVCYPKSDFFVCAASNILHPKVLSIPTGFVVQALCYDSENEHYYLGLVNGDNTVQKVYVLNKNLSILSHTDFAEPALHLNTLTYNPNTDELITIRSSGHELLVLNMSTGAVTVKTSLDDFNSGIQYDPVLDVYVGINGPAITGETYWNYRVYDSGWNIIRTGTFRTPYTYTDGETPNGFCCYDGTMVHSAFNTSGTQFTNRVQFLFGVDYFGNVDSVYQEYLMDMEYEGVAYNAGLYVTASVPSDGILLMTVIDPKAVFSKSLRKINSRIELPVSWSETYVSDASHLKAVIDMEDRTVTFSGYITLASGAVTDNTETTLGTIPNDYSPFGGNAALASVSGTAQTNLVVVGTDIRLTTTNGSSRYINTGGTYMF